MLMPQLTDFFKLALCTTQNMFHTDNAAVFGCEERRVQDDVLDIPASD